MGNLIKTKRIYTGGGSGGSGGSGVQSVVAGTNITVDNTDPQNPIVSSTADDIIVVANYSALPAPATVSGKFYWCSASQGTAWLPGSLGGTYYSAGLYYSNGVSWEFLSVPYQATQAEVNTGTNTDKFVTPSTFLNASKWSTKQDTITPAALTRVDDTNVTLTLGGTPATSLLQATSLTLGWTGTLSGTRGGTGTNNGASTLTLSGNTAYTMSGGGTISLGGFTLTVPATGTAALGTGANTRIATWSGTNTLSSDANFTWSGSALLVGGTSTADGGLLSVQKNQNAGTFATVINTTSGTGAFASLIASNAAGIGTNVSLSAISAGYSTSGIFVAGTGVINSSLTGGLNVGTSAGTALMFWTNNTEKARFLSTGEFFVGNTVAGALSEYVGFTKNQNARTRVAAYNTTSGTGAAVQYDMRNNNGVQASFGLHSSGFTTSGALIADGGILYCDGAGGLNISSANASGQIGIYTGGTAAANQVIKIDQNKNVILNASGAALATNATNGFAYISTCAGTPTGVPATLPTGALPMVIDSTNNKMYIYSSGSWVALN